MTSRLNRQRPTTLSRDEFVELGETLLTIANRQFGTPCKAEVRCFDTNYHITDCDMDWPLRTSAKQLRKENDAITRIRLERIQDLLPEDMQRGGLIKIDITPVNEKLGPASAWATMSIAGHKTGIEAYIQGGELDGSALKPLADVWDKQNPVAAGLNTTRSAPKRIIDRIRQAFA